MTPEDYEKLVLILGTFLGFAAFTQDITESEKFIKHILTVIKSDSKKHEN